MEALTRPYFVVKGEETTSGLTMAQEVDLLYWQKRGATSLVFFSISLPVAWSCEILRRLSSVSSSQIKRQTKALFRSLDLLHLYSYQRVALRKRKDLIFHQELLTPLQQTLQGRLLYHQEIFHSLKEKRIRSFPLFPYLQYLLLTKKILLFPSLSLQGKAFYCNRCGGEEVEAIDCPHCKLHDYMCISCQGMGESRLCRPLFGQQGDRKLFSPHRTSYQLDFQFSWFQDKTAKNLQDLILRKNRKQVLFFAVCGAGKTEVTFPLMDSFLKAGRPVLFTLPRRDVVHQLGERIREAFSPLSVLVLTGSSPTRYEEGVLVVATTHQVIRFYRRFHLIILDEFDAFPYSVEPMLDFAVKRALHREGHLVYMSATPGSEILQGVDRGELGLVQLPIRFHHQPLPEPELGWGHLKDMIQGEEIPPQLFRFLYRSLYLDRVQVFLFVPTRKLTDVVKEWILRVLQGEGRKVPVDAVHSKSPHREEKIQAFFQGKTQIMVTTTILERGVTIPRSHVLVLFACFEHIFDSQTLIQLSGRVGRSREYPTGRVLFLGERITPAMEKAKERIRGINHWAKEQGLFLE